MFQSLKTCNMKKSKFFILTGAVTLAILSFYGRKPYGGNTATSIKAGTTYGTLFSSGTSSFLTTVSPGAGKTAFFRTHGSLSTWVTMKTTGTSHHTIYFNAGG
jgi:hypothetical protein